MTPEQNAYANKKLFEISTGGETHEAYVIDCIPGMGSPSLCKVNPPVVGFGQNGDPYYQQYLHSWEEVNALIEQIRQTAEEAWGKER